MSSVAIIGAGLAGSEIALILAQHGIEVTLFEMRPDKMTPAHKTGLPAELVCSNSLKSSELPTAHALLKEELKQIGSPLINAAFANCVPAGSALAVDRLNFSMHIDKMLKTSKNINISIEECTEPPDGFDVVCIATGPLTSESMVAWIQKTFSEESLNFYDAIAPIIASDSIDMDKAFYASRWGKGEADYCNCPFTQDEFTTFYDALLEADTVVKHDFEDAVFFEACLPVEVIASRGYKALTFGSMKPVGLDDPRTGKWPFAICQLRKETTDGESLNMVGFQTRLKPDDQKRVFRMIPGLEHAEFLRYGTIHRNTYLDSPKLLLPNLSFVMHTNIFLAGQLCGNEGYTESIATGNLAAMFILAQLNGNDPIFPPLTTALGSLLNHVTSSGEKKFTPSNINYSLFPPLDKKGRRKIPKKLRKIEMAERAINDFQKWKENVKHILL